MSSLLIDGGRRISGKIEVEGNKNAALPLLAACLLTSEECVLTNMPRIGDVEVMGKLLTEIGAEVHGLGTTTVRVRARTIRTSNLWAASTSAACSATGTGWQRIRRSSVWRRATAPNRRAVAGSGGASLIVTVAR